MRAVPPSYVPLIAKMRFYVEPEVSCSRFFGKACFTEESLAAYRTTGKPADLVRTELGDTLAATMEGAAFVDAPCGLHAARDASEDFDVAPLARALGAIRMTEVDATAEVVRDRIPETIDVYGGGYALANSAGPSATRTDDGLEITTTQDDLLGWLAKFEPSDTRAVFYVSAVQPDAEELKDEAFARDVAVPYLEALYAEFSRCAKRGDVVILNSSDMLVEGIDEALFPGVHPVLALGRNGFTLLRRDAYNKMNVFVKD